MISVCFERSQKNLNTILCAFLLIILWCNSPIELLCLFRLHKKAGIALPENFLQSIVRYLLLLSQNVEESSKHSGLTLQLPSSCFNIENNRDLAQKFANQILNR